MQGNLLIRRAERQDVAAIAAMFAKDRLGGHGDSDDPVDLPLYLAAFERIAASPNDALHVAELEGEIVGTFQTTQIVTLTGKGAMNLLIRAVHTRVDRRGGGIGAAMICHAIEAGRALGAHSVQLTSNAQRADAHRFYARMGFAQSHLGFKMKLL